MTNSLTRNNNNCCTKTNSTFSGILKGFSLLLFVAISSFGMNAQGPINDLCADALPIACGETLAGSTQLASATGFPGSCSQDYATSGSGVWYSLEGNGEQLILSLCHDETNFDTHLALFTGECGDLTCLDGNDDWDNEFDPFFATEEEENNGGDVPPCATGLDAQIAWLSEPGTSYYAYVTGYSSATGDYGFSITCNALPQGCMDDAACNFDPLAIIDDASCNLPDGCTNDSALNFSASALCDDGSCVFCEPSLAIACPEDTDVACGESTDASFTGEPTTETTECTDEVVLTSEDTLTDNNDGCPFITRTWTATAGDLSASCDQIITLTDSEDPEFTSVIEDFSVTCEETFGYVSCLEYFETNITVPSFEDNCTLVDDLLVFVDYVDFDSEDSDSEELVCPVIFSCTRTITVTDQCGNTSSQITVLSLIDETAPEFINFAADSDIECNDELDLEALTSSMFELAGSDVSDDCTDVNITIEYDYIETGECQHVADFLAIVTASD